MSDCINDSFNHYCDDDDSTCIYDTPLDRKVQKLEDRVKDLEKENSDLTKRLDSTAMIIGKLIIMSKSSKLMDMAIKFNAVSRDVILNNVETFDEIKFVGFGNTSLFNLNVEHSVIAEIINDDTINSDWKDWVRKKHYCSHDWLSLITSKSRLDDIRVIFDDIKRLEEERLKAEEEKKIAMQKEIETKKAYDEHVRAEKKRIDEIQIAKQKAIDEQALAEKKRMQSLKTRRNAEFKEIQTLSTDQIKINIKAYNEFIKKDMDMYIMYSGSKQVREFEMNHSDWVNDFHKLRRYAKIPWKHGGGSRKK